MKMFSMLLLIFSSLTWAQNPVTLEECKKLSNEFLLTLNSESQILSGVIEYFKTNAINYEKLHYLIEGTPGKLGRHYNGDAMKQRNMSLTNAQTIQTQQSKLNNWKNNFSVRLAKCLEQ